VPSGQPSGLPSGVPSLPSGQPTTIPTGSSGQPSGQPSGLPTSAPVAISSRRHLQDLVAYDGECIISVVVSGIPVAADGQPISTAEAGIEVMTAQFIGAIDSGDFSRVLSSTVIAMHIGTLPPQTIDGIVSSSVVVANTSDGVEFSSAGPTSHPTPFVAPPKEKEYYEKWSLTALIGVAGGVVLVLLCMGGYVKYRSYSVGRIHTVFTSIEEEYIAQLGPVPLVSSDGRKIRAHGNGGRCYREVDSVAPVDGGGSTALAVITAADGETVLGGDDQPLVVNFVELDRDDETGDAGAVEQAGSARSGSSKSSSSSSKSSSSSSKSSSSSSKSLKSGAGDAGGVGVDETAAENVGAVPLLLEGVPDTSAIGNAGNASSSVRAKSSKVKEESPAPPAASAVVINGSDKEPQEDVRPFTDV
jgi:hypothetical protein